MYVLTLVAVLATPDEVIHRSRENSVKKDSANGRSSAIDLNKLEMNPKSLTNKSCSSKKTLEERRESLFGITTAPVPKVPKAEEVAHVRAVLAHITNNVPRVQSNNKYSLNPASSRKEKSSTAEVSAKKSTGETGKLKTSRAVENGIFSEGNLASQVTTRAAAKSSATNKGKEMNKSKDSGEKIVQQVKSRPHSQSSTDLLSNTNMQDKRTNRSTRNEARNKPRITVPQSPFLRSKQRSTLNRHQFKSSEELELEEIRRSKQQIAATRKRNLSRFGGNHDAGENKKETETERKIDCNHNRPVRKRHLTVPKSPKLQTSKRQRLHRMTTRSMEATSKNNHSQMNPLKSRSESATNLPSKDFTMGKKSLGGLKNKPRSGNQIQSRASAGTSTEGMRRSNRKPQVTLPKTPNFATASRKRASRFKPTEEAEMEKAIKEREKLQRIANVQRHRSKQHNGSKVLNADHKEGKCQPAKRKQLTEFKPFNLATDARASRRVRSIAQSTPPFVFGQDRGPVTRHRAQLLAAYSHTDAEEPSMFNNPEENKSGVVSNNDRDSSGNEMKDYIKAEGVNKISSSGIGSLNRGGSWLLGGAKRVLKSDNDAPNPENADKQTALNNSNKEDTNEIYDEKECRSIGEDGMQKAIRHGATLHNPLFNISAPQ